MDAAKKPTLSRMLSDGRFEIIERLGHGGMGMVFRGRDHKFKTDVVIKALLGKLIADPSAKARFERETRSLIELSHPHIVRIVDFGEDRGIPYIVLHYLKGGTLEDRLKEWFSWGVGPARADETLGSWLGDIAAALDFAHKRGYVHRDVKPSNILHDLEGNAYLSDFGVAKMDEATPTPAGERLTGAGLAVGTVDYMAPETILGKDVDGRADQYSLAVVVYFVLAGRKPFDSPNANEVLVLQSTAAPPPLDQLASQWPAAAREAVHRALAKKPQDRFDSCSEFARSVLQPLGLTGGSSVEIKLSPNAVAPTPKPSEGGSKGGRRFTMVQGTEKPSGARPRRVTAEMATVDESKQGSSSPLPDVVTDRRKTLMTKTPTVEKSRPVSERSFRREVIIGASLSMVVVACLWVGISFWNQKGSTSSARVGPAPVVVATNTPAPAIERDPAAVKVDPVVISQPPPHGPVTKDNPPINDADISTPPENASKDRDANPNEFTSVRRSVNNPYQERLAERQRLEQEEEARKAALRGEELKRRMKVAKQVANGFSLPRFGTPVEAQDLIDIVMGKKKLPFNMPTKRYGTQVDESSGLSPLGEMVINTKSQTTSETVESKIARQSYLEDYNRKSRSFLPEQTTKFIGDLKRRARHEPRYGAEMIDQLNRIKSALHEIDLGQGKPDPIAVDRFIQLVSEVAINFGEESTMVLDRRRARAAQQKSNKKLAEPTHPVNDDEEGNETAKASDAGTDTVDGGAAKKAENLRKQARFKRKAAEKRADSNVEEAIELFKKADALDKQAAEIEQASGIKSAGQSAPSADP